MHPPILFDVKKDFNDPLYFLYYIVVYTCIDVILVHSKNVNDAKRQEMYNLHYVLKSSRTECAMASKAPSVQPVDLRNQIY